MRVSKRKAIIMFTVVGILAITAAFYTAEFIKKPSIMTFQSKRQEN